MRTLAIGDIHGCATALMALLALVAPGEEDTLVFLGDYVDRGPDSRQVIERLLGISPTDRVHFLKGNHEVMLLGSLTDQEWGRMWLRVGGVDTLRSYGMTHPSNLPPEHLHFLEHICQAYWETETHIFVHASVEAHLPLEEQPEEALYWNRFGSTPPHLSGKVVVCGHTAQKTGHPKYAGNAICIDTWAYGRGWLTCLDVNSGHYWQANQRGRTRQGNLANLRNGILGFLPTHWLP